VRHMSPKRLSMSGKKSLLGKTSSSWASMIKNSPVVAQSTPQKPYRLSPIQDRKRRGSGGLLSRLAVQATRRDGEDCEAAQSFGGSRQWRLCAVYSHVFAERSDLSFIATEGGEQAAREAKRTARRWTEQSRIHFPLRQIVLASIWPFSSIVQSCVTKIKAQHRGTFRKPGHARASWRGEAGGRGGGARVREPSSHILLPQGEELTLYVGPTPSKLARWD
jgi:hypothetical protein